jgi:hypothetical protein
LLASGDEGEGRLIGAVGVCPWAAAERAVAKATPITATMARERVIKEVMTSLSDNRNSCPAETGASVGFSPEK